MVAVAAVAHTVTLIEMAKQIAAVTHCVAAKISRALRVWGQRVPQRLCELLVKTTPRARCLHNNKVNAPQAAQHMLQQVQCVAGL
jgi:hypothetical protein